MTLTEWVDRHNCVRRDLALIEKMVDDAYSLRSFFMPWVGRKKQRIVDAEMARLRHELDELLSASIEFPAD